MTTSTSNEVAWSTPVVPGHPTNPENINAGQIRSTRPWSGDAMVSRMLENIRISSSQEKIFPKNSTGSQQGSTNIRQPSPNNSFQTVREAKVSLLPPRVRSFQNRSLQRAPVHKERKHRFPWSKSLTKISNLTVVIPSVTTATNNVCKLAKLTPKISSKPSPKTSSCDPFQTNGPILQHGCDFQAKSSGRRKTYFPLSEGDAHSTPVVPGHPTHIKHINTGQSRSISIFPSFHSRSLRRAPDHKELNYRFPRSKSFPRNLQENGTQTYDNSPSFHTPRGFVSPMKTSTINEDEWSTPVVPGHPTHSENLNAGLSHSTRSWSGGESQRVVSRMLEDKNLTRPQTPNNDGITFLKPKLHTKAPLEPPETLDQITRNLLTHVEELSGMKIPILR